MLTIIATVMLAQCKSGYSEYRVPYLTSRASATIAEATGHAALVPSNDDVHCSLGNDVLWK